MEAIYTHDEAARIIECFENILEDNKIKVPSPEDDEREPDNEAPLYGSTYSDLLDEVEGILCAVLDKCRASDCEIIPEEFSGDF